MIRSWFVQLTAKYLGWEWVAFEPARYWPTELLLIHYTSDRKPFVRRWDGSIYSLTSDKYKWELVYYQCKPFTK